MKNNLAKKHSAKLSSQKHTQQIIDERMMDIKVKFCRHRE